MHYTDADVRLMQDIVLSDRHARPGFWEKILEHRYEKCMPRYVSRLFTFAVRGEHASSDLVYTHALFYAMVAYEPSVQNVIVKQLERARQFERLTFFRKVFVRQAKQYLDIMYNHPYTPDNTKCLLVIVVAELRVAWYTQSDYKYKLTREAEKQAIKDDIEQNKANKLAQAQMKQKTGRKKRRKPHAEEDEEIMEVLKAQ